MFPISLVLLLAAAITPVPPRFVVPDFPDTTIKIRYTYGLQDPRVTTLWLRGARERVEDQAEGTRFMNPVVLIVQCDERTLYELNVRAKTYARFTGLASDDPERVLQRHSKRDTGPEVTITINSIDTEERREMGSYLARRIKTTITVEPSKNASTPPSKTEIDGWYIDLAGLNCRGLPQPVPDVGFLADTSGHHDHLIFKYTGNTKRGFAVDWTSRRNEAGSIILNKTELVDFSDQPLDPSLFEQPPNYTLVQPGQNHRPQ